jgi:hypothetical protein
MTESDWRNATDAYPMLKFLHRRAVGWQAVLPGWLTPNRSVAGRQLRLFGAACCRSLWSFLGDEPGCEAVCVAERYAEGQASRDELRRVREQMLSQPGVRWWRRWLSRVYTFQMHEVWMWAQGMAWAVAADPDDLWRQITRLAWVAGPDGPLGMSLELVDGIPSPASLLRDVFGNPFSPASAVDPAWLDWNDGTVKRLAEAASEERSLPSGELDAGRLAVLCDGLEDAGCPSDHELLLHLRGPGPHVRGCWASDLLTART